MIYFISEIGMFVRGVLINYVRLWLQDLLRFRYLHKFVVSFGQGSRETLQDLVKNRVSLQKELYTGSFYPQCRYEPMPRIRRNDNARLLYHSSSAFNPRRSLTLPIARNYCTLLHICETSRRRIFDYFFIKVRYLTSKNVVSPRFYTV